MQTSEPASTRAATDAVVKILNSTYTKSNIDKVAAAAVPLDRYTFSKIINYYNVI